MNMGSIQASWTVTDTTAGSKYRLFCTLRNQKPLLDVLVNVEETEKLSSGLRDDYRELVADDQFLMQSNEVVSVPTRSEFRPADACKPVSYELASACRNRYNCHAMFRVDPSVVAAVFDTEYGTEVLQAHLDLKIPKDKR